MRILLIISVLLCTSILYLIVNPIEANATPTSYNYSAITPPIWTTVIRGSPTNDVFLSTANNGTVNAWYSYTSGNKLVQVIGPSPNTVAPQILVFNNALPISASTGNLQGALSSTYAQRIGEKILAGNSLIGQTVQSITVELDKGGAPTGTLQLVIRDNSNIVRAGATQSVTALTTSYVAYTYTLNATRTIQANDRISLEYSNGDGLNYVNVGGSSTQPANSNVFEYFSASYHEEVTGVPMYLTLITPAQSGPPTISIGCSFIGNTTSFVSNMSNIYYNCGSVLDHTNINTNSTTQDFVSSCSPLGVMKPFITNTKILAWCFATGGGNSVITTVGGSNVTIGADSNAPTIYSSESIGSSSQQKMLFATTNSSNLQSIYKSNNCNFWFLPSNSTSKMDDIACDGSIPSKIIRFYNGLAISGIAGYYSNSTLLFTHNTDINSYKVPLTLPIQLLGISSLTDPYISFILHANSINYLIIMTSNNIYYTNVNNVMLWAQQNHAIQTYLTTIPSTTSNYEVPHPFTPVTSKVFISGNGINSTITRFGMLSIPSGYSIKVRGTSTNTQTFIDSIYPQWTYDGADIPLVSDLSGTNFQNLITVSNAPTDSAIKVTSPTLLISGIESIWSVTQLDASHSAQVDLPIGTCANLYVGDISQHPVIYIYQGSLCATGLNQKTIQYTNTVPLSFYTMTYGATSSYTPSTNGLAVTTRATTPPYTENIIIKNSTGIVTQNYTQLVNSTTFTHTFNVSSTSKPASLYVNIVGKGQIYSTYLGSSLSFASVVSFFHQYLSYQGFDFLAFIPIIFASMFTRNTVGIGTALTVVAIATLSYLSVTVVSDTVVGVSIVIAIIGMIGYRSLYG